MISRPLHLANAIRHRFHAAHLSAEIHARPILDVDDNIVGCLDTIEVAHGRLRVAGWVKGGSKVTLVLAGAKAQTKPDLYRQDVAAATGCHPKVGFDFSLPATPSMLLQSEPAGMLVNLTNGSQPSVRPVSLPFKGLTRRLRLLDLKLSGKAAGLVWPTLKWLRSRDEGVKRQILARLNLDDLTNGPNQILDAAVFAKPSGAELEAINSRVTIVLPVYNAFDLLPDVIERVLTKTDLPFHLIMIDDASPDRQVWPWIKARVASHVQDPSKFVTLLQNDENFGFIGTVNRALVIALNDAPPCPAGITDGPVILLNSDAFVPQNWASRLVRPLLHRGDIATTTPMSNDAEIFSVPCICARSDLAENSIDELDAYAMQFDSMSKDIDVPTGVGFCMAISRDWLAKVGVLDTAFGRGYGEEVDWCQRARNMGGRHLAVRNLFVEHRGGSSFGSADKLAMITKNNAIVSKRYPEFDQDVRRFIQMDPMLTERLALGVIWADQMARASGGKLPVYIAHSLGGGAEIHLKRQIAENIKNLGCAVVLRVGGLMRWQIELHTREKMTLGSTQDTDLMLRLMSGPKERDIFYSCGVGDTDPLTLPAMIASLRGPSDKLTVLVHDFFMVSPSYTLTNSDDVFGGTPTVKSKSTDADHTFLSPDGTLISLQHWQNSWGKMLRSADTITVFSQDSANHIMAAYADVAGQIVVCPHSLPVRPRPVRPTRKQDSDFSIRIGVLGGISRAKGAFVLQGLSKSIADGRLDAQLIVIGEVDPTVPLSPATVIHGRYDPQSVTDLAEHYRITHWLIPSVWPETFSFTTHEALATGLPVLTFDLGAQSEIASRASNGYTLAFPQTEYSGAALMAQLVDNITNFLHSDAANNGLKRYNGTR